MSMFDNDSRSPFVKRGEEQHLNDEEYYPRIAKRHQYCDLLVLAITLEFPRRLRKFLKAIIRYVISIHYI